MQLLYQNLNAFLDGVDLGTVKLHIYHFIFQFIVSITNSN